MDSQGAGFAFDTNMDFNSFTMPQQQQSFMKPAEDNTSASFFFGDEGIDTTTGFSQLDTMNPALLSTPQQTSFDMQQTLTMDNTSGSASAWNAHLTPNLHQSLNTFPPTPVQSFDALYQPSTSTLGKRPLQLDVPDFPQAKRHETADFTLFSPYTSAATASNSWALDAQPTPATSIEVGLSDEAADVCATWFNKYNVLPSDRHIDSLSQLTGESADAIRSWFGQLLKQGMGSQDSAYKSQTSLLQQESFWNDQYSTDIIQTSPPQLVLQAEEQTTPEVACSHDTTTVNQATALRGGKKRCTPTEDRSLLGRDANKIYQCTRKCGKRYGRKCDWKRNEEEGYPCKSWVCSLCKSEGVENVKPCFRKYHFVQHFRNIHPEINAEEYEEASIVCSETEFPRNCGFCRHRFVSRQERIDHIADHFKQGKCMLEWNEEDVDETPDSDNADDDDDDRPSGDGFDSNRSSRQPPSSGSRGSSGSNYYGGGNSDSSSGSGGQQSHGDFFHFQLSQCTEGGSGTESTCAKQHVRTTLDLQTNQQRPTFLQEGESQHSIAGSISTERPKPHPKQYVPTAGDHKNALAGNALARPIADLGQIQARTTQDDQSLIAATQYSKSARVSITYTDALMPATQSERSQTSDGVSLSSAIAIMPTSTNRARLRLSDDRRSDSLNVQQSSTAIIARNAPPVTQEDKHSTGVLAELKTPQSISITPQSFLSVKLLGAGGFSTVDEVVHRETNLRLGRKTLKNRDQTAMEELRKEVDVLQKLRHPHVIRFLGAYSKGDKMSILLSPVADTTLQLWLERFVLQKPANLSEMIVKMFGCLASSVRYLHEQRPVIKHMDIKPQNILIVEGDQEFPHVVLCDFGISSSEDIPDGQSKPLTRQYIAPEVFEGFTRKQAADIWSLGCVFAEMASVPYSQDNSTWLEFRKEFSGRNGKYYWQDVEGLQNSLSGVLEKASTATEQTVLHTLKSMLSADPTSRPDAASLTMIFTPASCCLNWPNDKAIFPGPHEELDGVEMLVHKDCTDCSIQRQLRGEINDQFDTHMSHAKMWLEECSHTHDACHQPALSEAKTLPTRLVDIRPHGQEGSFVRIVNSASIEASLDRFDYVALSHVWNSDHVTLTSDSQQSLFAELPLQTLPSAVNTAIATARRLGYHYIWVDSLCILQDSEDDKRQECANMASVFRNAALTVVLDQLTTDSVEGKADTLTTSDSPNVKPLLVASTQSSSLEARLPVSASLPAIDFTTPGFAWDTRAWALQERLLSRRFLHLGEQMYWECNSLKASETFPQGLSPLVWEKVHSKANERIHSAASNRTENALSVAVGIDTLEKKPISIQPRLLRNCQWIKKQGDGIGDSMEAAQLTLTAGDDRHTSPSDTSKPHGHGQTEAESGKDLPNCTLTHDNRSCRNCDTAQAGAYTTGTFARLPLGNHVFFEGSDKTTTTTTTTTAAPTSTTRTADDQRTAPATTTAPNFASSHSVKDGRQEINLAGQLDQNGNRVLVEVTITLQAEHAEVQPSHVEVETRDVDMLAQD